MKTQHHAITQTITSTTKPNMSGWYVLRIVGELGYIIALPLVAFLVIGHIIDLKLGTKVIFTLVGMALALGTSTYIIYRKIEEISK